MTGEIIGVMIIFIVTINYSRIHWENTLQKSLTEKKILWIL